MQASNVMKSKMYAADLPWNTWNPDDLGPTIMTFVRDHEAFFRRWSDQWYANFQFLFGNHSLKWSRQLGIAVDHDFLRRNTPFTMRSQTNIARVVAEALAALIYSNLPEWAVEAMDESSVRGKRFKKIVQKLLDCYMERLNMDREFALAALIFVVFGQVAWKVDWNFSGGKMLEIPRYRKVKAPVFTSYMAPNQVTGGLIETPIQALDSQGAPMFDERWEAVVDATGRQIIDRFFAGDVFVNTLTPFQYRRELGSPGMHKTKYVQEVRLLDYDEWMDEADDIPGPTKHARNVRPVWSDEMVYAFAVRHFMRMQFTTPPTVDDGFRRAQSVLKSSLFRHKVFVVEHYDKPHPKKWPLGRKVVVVNGVCTHVTTPTYHTNKLDGWHPFVEAQWMNIAPSSIASGPMDDVIRKNREMDTKDGLISTAVRRNMGSFLAVKAGAGFDTQKITGTPGEIHTVNDPYGARWVHDELPMPPVLSALREQDKQDCYDVSGAGEALRGEPSETASSGYQEKQREEREQKRLAPAKKAFKLAVGAVGEKLLACLKTNVVKLDEQVMGYMKRSAAGEFTVQDVVAFLSNPLDFGVDIKVKGESMAARSEATEQATLMELAGGPLQQRLATDANVLDKFLDKFGADTLRDASAPHRDRAARENEVFIDMLRLGADLEGVQRPVVCIEDDDLIHQASHAEFFTQNAEEFFKNEVALQQFLTHQEMHRLQAMEKQGQLQPGTSLQVPNMMAAGRQLPPPTVQTIYTSSMMKQQEQQQQQQAPNPQAPQGQAQAPQAPRQPKPVGQKGGAGPINPQAPSANTPTAKAGGPAQ